MKIYSDKLENGCVEALLLIEPREAAQWEDTESAVNAAIAHYAQEKRLGMLLFPRVLDCDEQPDGALLLRFEAAIKPNVSLGQYKGLTIGVARADGERFAETAMDKAAENAAMEIPALLVERRLELMRLQRRNDVLQSVSYQTLADVWAILKDCNERLEIPQSPEWLWARAMDMTAQLTGEGGKRSTDVLLSSLAEAMYGEDFEAEDLRKVGEAVEARLRRREETDAETAAEELFALYLKTRSQTEEDWRSEYRSTAAELVRTELMLDAVAEQEGLAVSDTELQTHAAALGTEYGISAQEVLALTGEENLRFQLLRAKAKALIVESAEQSNF
jgi:FKBP-type peptidyl-prolyl cis-trans isomerase (trigger factor)